MKYEVEIKGARVNVELDRSTEPVRAVVDSRDYEFEVVSSEEGSYTLLIGDRVYEARVWTNAPNSFRVDVGGKSFPTKLVDRRLRRSAADQGTEGRQNLLAPMPGKVVQILLAPGDQVKAGQGVLVVEAMKMQNEIKSPKAGVIIEIRVTAGAAVNANQILAVVE